MFGWSESEVLGREPPIVPDDRRDAFRELCETVLGGEEVRGRDVRRESKDGDPVDCAVWATPLEGPRGETIGLQAVCIDVSRRKAAERHQQLFTHNVAGVFVQTMDGEILDCNEAFARIFGYDSAEDAMSVPLDAYFPEEIEPTKSEAARRLLEDGEVRNQEVRRLRKDGSPVRLLMNARLLDDPEREESVVLATMIDVTERREAQQRYRGLFELSRDAIFALDADGTIVEANERAAEWTGWSREELRGKPVVDLHPPDLRDEARAAGRRILEEGHDRFELEIRRRDGEQRLGEFSAHAIEVGGRVLMQSIGRDVTERRRREEKLERSEERFRSLFEDVPDPISITTEDGEIVRVNDAFLQLYGYDRRELEELSAGDLYDDPGRREEVVERLRRDGSVTDVEVAVRTKDGERRLLELTESFTEDEEGNRYIRTVARDVTERRELEDQLRHRALHDHLTGLANRALFGDRLEHALTRVERSGQALALLYVDLDRFKVVNDSLGHEAGDHVLQEVARRIVDTVRSPDTVARIGGDEFTVLLEQVEGGDDAHEVALRLADALQQPHSVDGTTVPLEVSIGVAVADPDADTELPDPDAFLDQADRAMFEAKETPRTAVSVARRVSEPVDTGPTLLEREARLREALEEGEIGVAYQPILSLSDRRAIGVEALARWTDADGEPVPPGRFIPLAERTGLIQELGTQILEKSTREVGRRKPWAAGGGSGRGGEEDFFLCVNLSAQEVDAPDAVERFRRVLAATEFPAERLQLEVTERVAVQRAELLNRLKRELGARLAVDDFGTRQSSLAQLIELDIDTVKVDRDFVARVAEDSASRTVVEVVLTLGRRMGLDVIAEGIETAEQEETLVSMGCPFVQGFRYGRPGPLDDHVRGNNGASPTA